MVSSHRKPRLVPATNDNTACFAAVKSDVEVEAIVSEDVSAEDARIKVRDARG